MRQILFITIILLQLTVYGQNTIYGKVLSVGDNNPVSMFLLKADRKQLIVTDSTGAFSFSTKKKKIKLSFLYTMTKSKDTTIFTSKDITNVYLFTNLTWDSTQAKYDIKQNTIKLFCCFGFHVMVSTQMDEDFEKEYGVKYYILGDYLIAPISKLRIYNNTIGKYLDNKYGVEWRKRTKAIL